MDSRFVCYAHWASTGLWLAWKKRGQVDGWFSANSRGSNSCCGHGRCLALLGGHACCWRVGLNCWSSRSACERRGCSRCGDWPLLGGELLESGHLVVDCSHPSWRGNRRVPRVVECRCEFKGRARPIDGHHDYRPQRQHWLHLLRPDRRHRQRAVGNVSVNVCDDALRRSNGS